MERIRRLGLVALIALGFDGGKLWADESGPALPVPQGPSLPEPAPLPKMFPAPSGESNLVLPVSDQRLMGTPVSTFNRPDQLPSLPNEPRFPIEPQPLTPVNPPASSLVPIPAETDTSPASSTPPQKDSSVPHRVRGELPKTWGADEYLLWWIKDSPNLPPLATSGLQGVPPVIGGSNTRVLNDGPIEHSERSGGRFNWGWSFGDEKTIGMEIIYFFLGTRTDHMRYSHNGMTTNTLGRPFIDANTGEEDALLIAEPGRSRGYIQAASSSRLTGWEVNGVGHLFDSCHFEIDGLFGWRYMLLNEGLRVDSYSTPVMGTAGDMLPDYLMISDQIDASNRFFGGQLGFKTNFRQGGLFVETVGKIAFGQTNHVVRIHGVSATAGSDVPLVVSRGGFFGQESNTDRFTDSTISWLPEGSVRVGFHFSNHSRFFVGYNFLYLSDVVRPEGQIERTIDPKQVPMLTYPPVIGTATRPEFRMSRTDFWAQGLLIGLESRW